jgi:hypothetical protein
MRAMRYVILLFIFCHSKSQAQFQYLVEYNAALNVQLNDLRPFTDLITDNNFSLVIKKGKTFGIAGFGREDWYLGYFNNKYYTNASIYNAHCRTYKISVSIERQFFVIKSKLSLNLGVGIKTYFLNQMSDSLSRSIYGNLSTMRPPYLQDAKEKNINKLNGVDLNDLFFVTSVPYALTANIAMQYSFKKLGLKLYYQPYFMKIKYETVKSSTEGSNFTFYSNIGLGINYPLNFKKKDQKVTGIE